jgi:hypothetical protein
VKIGDFEGAVTPLAAVIEELTPDLRRREELSQAYLFLGVAYLEMNQELEARGKFREALRNDPKLSLSPSEFSPQVIRVFETERAVLHPKKKKLFLPLLLVLGGGAAAAGVAAAASGGDSSPTTLGAGSPSTTRPTGGAPTTTLPGGPTTTRPGSPTTTTTTLAPTSTTLPGSSTTTTSTTTSTSTTTTTSTMPPACTYQLAPDKTIGLAGGSGVCAVNVNVASCPWSVEVFPASASTWLSLTPPTAGTGNGAVSYSVALLVLGSRSAEIRAQQDHGARCTITQQALLAAPPGTAQTLQSRLDLAGGSAQTILNGSTVLFQQDAVLARMEGAQAGLNRVEGTIVAAAGRPGTWRFELSSGSEPGSLRVVAGQARVVTPDSVLFQLSGRAGERVVFVFKGRSQP